MALALKGADRLLLPENLRTCLAEAKSSLLALEEALKEAWEDKRSGQEELLADNEKRCSEAELAAARLQKELGAKASHIEDLQEQLAEGQRLLQKREEETKKLQVKVRRLEEAAAPRVEKPPRAAAAPADSGAAAEKDAPRRALSAARRGSRSSASSRCSSGRGRGAKRASPPREAKKESPSRRASRRSPSRGSPGRHSPGRERSRSRDRRAPVGRSRSRRRKASASRSRERDSRSCSPAAPPGKDRKGPPAKGRGDQGALCIPFVMGNCLAGDKCKNRHPRDDDLPNAREALKRKVCKFGADCKRRDCIFVHPGRDEGPRARDGARQAAAADARDGRGADRGSGRAAAPCRYGSQCKRPDCKFSHEAAADPPGRVDRQCRYGASCKRPDCKFQHP